MEQATTRQLHFSQHALKRLAERFPLVYRKFGTAVSDFFAPLERYNRDPLFQAALRRRYPYKSEHTRGEQPFVVYTFNDMLVLTRDGVVITLYHRVSGTKIFEAIVSDYKRDTGA